MILLFVQQSSMQCATCFVMLAKLQNSVMPWHISIMAEQRTSPYLPHFFLSLLPSLFITNLNLHVLFTLIALMPCGMTVEPWLSVLSCPWPWRAKTTLIAKLILDCRMWYRKWLVMLSWHVCQLLSSGSCWVSWKTFMKKMSRKKGNRDISWYRPISEPYRQDSLHK